jgi:hypothetical protein
MCLTLTSVIVVKKLPPGAGSASSEDSSPLKFIPGTAAPASRLVAPNDVDSAAVAIEGASAGGSGSAAGV